MILWQSKKIKGLNFKSGVGEWGGDEVGCTMVYGMGYGMLVQRRNFQLIYF